MFINIKEGDIHIENCFIYNTLSEMYGFREKTKSKEYRIYRKY